MNAETVTTHGRIEIVLDIESYSLDDAAHILSIGAVAVDVLIGQIVDTFDSVIGVEEQPGRVIDQSTVDWWYSEKVSDEARDVAIRKTNRKLPDVLRAFVSFVEQYPEAGIWGNGSDFDNRVVGHACRQHRIDWPYWRNRDLRTGAGLVNVSRPTRPDNLVPHIAIDDAKYEAIYLCDVFQRLGQTGVEWSILAAAMNSWLKKADLNYADHKALPSEIKKSMQEGAREYLAQINQELAVAHQNYQSKS